MFKLKDIQDRSGKSFDELIELVKTVLHDKPYTKDELIELLGVKELTQKELFPTRPAAEKVLQENNEYIIKARCLHVFSEAKRVYDFIDVCKKPAYDNQLNDLGKILDESHRVYFNYLIRVVMKIMNVHVQN